MKHLKFFSLLVFAMLFFTSCEKGVDPQDPVGLLVAFSHCFGLTSYLVWGFLITGVVGLAIFQMIKNYQKTGNFSQILLFFLIAALLFAWLYRPSEIAWNTTVEQAAKGVWIGF